MAYESVHSLARGHVIIVCLDAFQLCNCHMSELQMILSQHVLMFHLFNFRTRMHGHAWHWWTSQQVASSQVTVPLSSMLVRSGALSLPGTSYPLHMRHHSLSKQKSQKNQQPRNKFFRLTCCYLLPLSVNWTSPPPKRGDSNKGQNGIDEYFNLLNQLLYTVN